MAFNRQDLCMPISTPGKRRPSSQRAGFEDERREEAFISVGSIAQIGHWWLEVQ